MSSPSFGQRLAAEFLGTLTLVATVVGSGIMAETLAGGNVAVALLGNTIATGAILYVLITILGPVSGAHMNPAVSVMFMAKGDLPARQAGFYILVQVLGGICGTVLAHFMFEQVLFQPGDQVRTGLSQWVSESVATFGLCMTILGCLRFRPDAVAAGVGLFITAGYWFTSSTSFANPAVTIARSFTQTFSGIRPEDMPWFIAAQIIGALAAMVAAKYLFSAPAEPK